MVSVLCPANVFTLYAQLVCKLRWGSYRREDIDETSITASRNMSGKSYKGICYHRTQGVVNAIEQLPKNLLANQHVPCSRYRHLLLLELPLKLLLKLTSPIL